MKGKEFLFNTFKYESAKKKPKPLYSEITHFLVRQQTTAILNLYIRLSAAFEEHKTNTINIVCQSCSIKYYCKKKPQILQIPATYQSNTHQYYFRILCQNTG